MTNFALRKLGVALLTITLLLAGSVALAAGGGEHPVDSGVLLKDFLYRCFNFAVTIGLLAYFVTKPLRKGLAGRRDGIAKTLAEAEQAKAMAEARFTEYDRKLSQASAEIEGIYIEIRREGELEREKILANAREMAEKIKREARKSAELEVAKARRELRQEAARLAIVTAEKILKKRVTPQDQDRLMSEYMQKVGELH
jgi:F-type H+-transporting ATPase subunit b